MRTRLCGAARTELLSSFFLSSFPLMALASWCIGWSNGGFRSCDWYAQPARPCVKAASFVCMGRATTSHAGGGAGRSPSFICEMLKTFAPHFFKPKTRHTLQVMPRSEETNI
jgi:hypothetical protein